MPAGEPVNLSATRLCPNAVEQVGHHASDSLVGLDAPDDQTLPALKSTLFDVE